MRWGLNCQWFWLLHLRNIAKMVLVMDCRWIGGFVCLTASTGTPALFDCFYWDSFIPLLCCSLVQSVVWRNDVPEAAIWQCFTVGWTSTSKGTYCIFTTAWPSAHQWSNDERVGAWKPAAQKENAWPSANRWRTDAIYGTYIIQKKIHSVQETPTCHWKYNPYTKDLHPLLVLLLNPCSYLHWGWHKTQSLTGPRSFVYLEKHVHVRIILSPITSQ